MYFASIEKYHEAHFTGFTPPMNNEISSPNFVYCFPLQAYNMNLILVDFHFLFSSKNKIQKYIESSLTCTTRQAFFEHHMDIIVGFFSTATFDHRKTQNWQFVLYFQLFFQLLQCAPRLAQTSPLGKNARYTKVLVMNYCFDV